MNGLAAFQPDINNLINAYNAVESSPEDEKFEEVYYNRRNRLENILNSMPNASNDLASDYNLLAKPLTSKGLVELYSLFKGANSARKLLTRKPNFHHIKSGPITVNRSLNLFQYYHFLKDIENMELLRAVGGLADARDERKEQADLQKKWILELYDKHGADLSDGLLYGSNPYFDNSSVNNIIPEYANRRKGDINNLYLRHFISRGLKKFKLRDKPVNNGTFTLIPIPWSFYDADNQ